MAEAQFVSYRLFPYERALAAREAVSICGEAAVTERGVVIPDGTAHALAERCTYFASVRTGSTQEATRQHEVEARHSTLRGSEQRRQATRYGLHGVHEYKGKFNPQLVRALVNIVEPGADLLIDPFCGSGTSLMEAARLGIDAIGIDRSPFAVFLAEAKTSALLATDRDAVRREFQKLSRTVADDMKEAQQCGAVESLVAVVDHQTEVFLRNWFPAESLAAIAAALRHLGNADRPAVALVRVSLSTILRDASYQLPEDLRVRRRPTPFAPPSLGELFLDSCDRIDLGLEEIEHWPTTASSVAVRHGSSTTPESLDGVDGHERRLILTSPPYATALPYIDTDRLSIAALGLAPATELRALERALVGSREWNKPEEAHWWRRLEANVDELPPVVVDLARAIHSANLAGKAGFRRAAVPALLYRYFASMADSLSAWHQHLKRGERAVLIVGNNRTTTVTGDEIAIRTPHLLGAVGESRGYELEEVIPLETWPRYGMHSRNGVDGEDAVVLRKR